MPSLLVRVVKSLLFPGRERGHLSRMEISLTQRKPRSCFQNFSCISWFSKALAQINSDAKEAYLGVAYSGTLQQSTNIHIRALQMVPASKGVTCRVSPTPRRTSPAGKLPSVFLAAVFVAGELQKQQLTLGQSDRALYTPHSGTKPLTHRPQWSPVAPGGGCRVTHHTAESGSLENTTRASADDELNVFTISQWAGVRQVKKQPGWCQANQSRIFQDPYDHQLFLHEAFWF